MELLSVSPQQLTFYAPFNGPQRRILTLLNPTQSVVLFKVKTNAVRYFRLRPNTGRVEPYATIEIRICIQCIDFRQDQEYHHYLSIHSFLKPKNCFNGETFLTIFQSLPREHIYNQCLPIKLQSKPLFLSDPCLEKPCMKLIMERNQPLRPVCPRCSVASKPKKYRRKILIKNQFVAIIIVSVLAAFLIAYFLHKSMDN